MDLQSLHKDLFRFFSYIIYISLFRYELWLCLFQPLNAWGGPYNGTVYDIPASEWTSYLPVANHPEYPSASTGKEFAAFYFILKKMLCSGRQASTTYVILLKILVSLVIIRPVIYQQLQITRNIPQPPQVRNLQTFISY